MDTAQAPGDIAVVRSFFGDHKNSIATIPTPFSPEQGAGADQRMLPAIPFLVEKAKEYHFFLINEAHYSAQNRAFTKKLLAPLWEQGYRYLALEALAHEDSLIIGEGYPIINTGYYIKESVFGNLVREALAIGYKLIPYETRKKEDGTLKGGTPRDWDQAHFIYTKTLKKDSAGKVLVHAGFSHINKVGGRSYQPMGAQLKALARQDVLTVDQQTMTEKPKGVRLHPHYKKALNRYELNEPMILVDANNQPVVDFINSFGIDVQVYHPTTNYIQGRPDWQLAENSTLISLPTTWKENYAGYLLQATPEGERPDAVPADQIVIDHENP